MKKNAVLLLLILFFVISVSFSLSLTQIATVIGYRSVDSFNNQFIFGEKDGTVSLYNNSFKKIGNYKISKYPITVVGATMGMNGYVLLFGDTTGKIFRYTDSFKYVGSLKPFNSQTWSIAKPKMPGIPKFVVGSLKGIMVEFVPSELMGRPKKEGFAPASVNDLNIENSNSSSQIWDLDYVSNDMVLNTITIDGILTSFEENSFSFRQIAKENINRLAYCTTTIGNLVFVGGNDRLVCYKADFTGIEPWKEVKKINISDTAYSMDHDSKGNILVGNENGEIIVYNKDLQTLYKIKCSNVPIWTLKVFNVNFKDIIVAIDNNGLAKIFEEK